MSIPTSDRRHPAYVDAAPLEEGERGRFADRHARNPRACADCGLLNRHRPGCASVTPAAAPFRSHATRLVPVSLDAPQHVCPVVECVCGFRLECADEATALDLADAHNRTRGEIVDPTAAVEWVRAAGA